MLIVYGVENHDIVKSRYIGSCKILATIRSQVPDNICSLFVHFFKHFVVNKSLLSILRHAVANFLAT